MNTETIKTALVERGYQHVTVLDGGSYLVINAQPAQYEKSGRLKLGDHLRALGFTIKNHQYYVDTEMAHVAKESQ